MPIKLKLKTQLKKKFKVRVTNVRTLILKGKKKEMLTRRGRYEGYRADKKKAFVTLHKDDNIDFFGEAS